MQLKIYPISSAGNFYHFSAVLKKDLKCSSYAANTLKSPSNLPYIYYRPMSFTGLQDNYLREQLMSLEGIHCPSCNTVMLTDDSYNSIIEKSKDIKNAEEFVSFLKEHEDNIQPIYRPIIAQSEKIISTKTGLTCDDLLNMLSAGAIKKYAITVKNSNYDIDDFLSKNELSDNDKRLLYTYKAKTKEMVRDNKLTYKAYRRLVENTLYNLETENKWTLYHNVKDKVRDAGLYRFIFTSNSSRRDMGISKKDSVLRNLFGLSKSNLVFVSESLENGRNKACNTLLECKHCKENNFNIPALIMRYGQPAKDNFDKYVDDISKAALSDKLYKNISYPVEVNQFVKAICKEDRKILNTNLLHVKNQMFLDNLSKINFDIVNQNDIPCACCGKQTITHDERVVLEREVRNTKNMHELEEILDDHSSIIRPAYKPMVKEFKRILADEPDISEEDMIRKLKYFSRNSINETLNGFIVKLNEPSKINKYKKQAQELIREFTSQAPKFLTLNKKKPFPLNDYLSLLYSTLGKMEAFGKDDLVYKMKQIIMQKQHAEYLLYKTPDSYQEARPIQLIVMSLMAKAVATKDHLEASDLGGSDDKSNLVVMCKECNSEKGRETFSYFLKHHKMMKDNLPKYLNKVQKLVDEQTLQGYDTYKNDVIKHINEDLLKNDSIKF